MDLVAPVSHYGSGLRRGGPGRRNSRFQGTRTIRSGNSAIGMVEYEIF